MTRNIKFPSLSNPLVLSPMAGVTDVAFRVLCRNYGASLTFTEFVNSTAITRNNERTYRYLQKDESENPIGVQLYGSNVSDVITAAQAVEKDFDIIDINCGCPVWKVIKSGAGSAMLKKPDSIFNLVTKLVASVNKPITVKIRSGIDENHINAVEVAKLIEEAGASAITIHGRTQKQEYRGVADWDIIKKVKDALNIPVIGNGDIMTPEDCKKRLEESGVDAVMIARGAMGNPFIFKQALQFLNNEQYDQTDKLRDIKKYIDLAEKFELNFFQMQSNSVQMTRGLNGAARLRVNILKCKTIEELKNIIK